MRHALSLDEHSSLEIDLAATNLANAAGAPANVNYVQVQATADYPAHWVEEDALDQGNGGGPEV